MLPEWLSKLCEEWAAEREYDLKLEHDAEIDELRSGYQAEIDELQLRIDTMRAKDRRRRENDTAAMFNLGVLLATRWDPPDLLATRGWWERAAAAGHTGAMHELDLLGSRRDQPTLFDDEPSS